MVGGGDVEVGLEVERERVSSDGGGGGGGGGGVLGPYWIVVQPFASVTFSRWGRPCWGLGRRRWDGCGIAGRMKDEV